MFNNAAIIGVGQSAYTRRPEQPVHGFMRDAVVAALRHNVRSENAELRQVAETLMGQLFGASWNKSRAISPPVQLSAVATVSSRSRSSPAGCVTHSRLRPSAMCHMAMSRHLVSHRAHDDDGVRPRSSPRDPAGRWRSDR